MPPKRPSRIYVGIKGHVIAFNRTTGERLWEQKLKSSMNASYVHVLRDNELLFATTAGEVFCLDPITGNVLWHDPMRGKGTDIASLASDSAATSESTPSHAMIAAMRRAAAAAAAT